ncbi:ankyrin repeat domain-containing protein [Streptomyces sp. NPDC048643]|uniref:ankyrin repeat domain-containing protein n=1 Tax=Streptomyces sp. NPDC048643 TaxID=3155637 RepID=UPI003442F259
MAEHPLITAVRGGHEDTVRLLLDDGADPNTTDEHGIPALCLAITAFHSSIASYLMASGADPDCPLPDGTTPRLRAVDSGSIALASSLLGDPALVTEPVRAALLVRARQWHKTGPIAMLRERTASTDPVERLRVRDAPWSTEYDEIRLGGEAVRDGQAGTLTYLEECFGLHLQIVELADRACALEYPDREHASWYQITNTLAERQDDETWEAAAALRTHPDPLHRRFGLEVLISLNLTSPLSHHPGPFEKRTLDFLIDRVAKEQHPDVLAEILAGLAHHDDPRIEPLGITYTAHPAPQVRAQVPSTLKHLSSLSSGRWTHTPSGLDAMLTLARDPDPAIRKLIAYQLAESSDSAHLVGDVLAELLGDEDQVTRIWAAYGLAERDDPRCVDGARRVGQVAEYDAWSWILRAPSRYQERRRKQPETPVTPE